MYLYCGYKYTRPCVIDRIWGLKPRWSCLISFALVRSTWVTSYLITNVYTLLNRLYGKWTHLCWFLFPLEFTLYFPVYGLYCYFWHDCTFVSESTWCRNIRTVKNIAYRYKYKLKHSPWFVLPQYMIDCRLHMNLEWSCFRWLYIE